MVKIKLQRKMQPLQDKSNVIENKLSKLYSDKVKGAQIRSRIKWVEEGEKKHKILSGT